MPAYREGLYEKMTSCENSNLILDITEKEEKERSIQKRKKKMKER